MAEAASEPEPEPKSKPKADLALGEVLLEHDVADKAIEAFRKAMELAPSDAKYQKALALALERTGTTGGNEERIAKHADSYIMYRQIYLDDEAAEE